MKEQVYKSTFYNLISSFTTDFVRQIIKNTKFSTEMANTSSSYKPWN